MARTKSSNAWLKRHVNDPYVRRAQVEGYRSRAAYKLLQIAERDRLLAPGMVVVDLGATPGGWSQVAAKAVGGRGAVIALDILVMEPIRGVTFLHGDFEEDAVLAALESELGGRTVDLVLSDMAPNMSGIPSADQARVMGLAELARDFAIKHLKPNGNFLVKVFHGAGFDEFLKSLRAAFRQVVIRKPDASRRESSEVYLLARGRR